MKKIIAIVAVILVIAAGIFIIRNQASPSPDKQDESTTVDLSDLFFIQYRVFAPRTAVVALDGEVLSYNESIDCFSTEVKEEGSYTLVISQEGCETIEEKVDISPESHEYTAELTYDPDFLKYAESEGKKLLEEIIHKCWGLDYDLSEYNFLSEEERADCEGVLADVGSALEENISAGYKMSDLTLSLTHLDTIPYDSDDAGKCFFISFETDYSYDWEFNGDAYNDSGSKNIISKASIAVEKNGVKWYIRDIALHLYNGTM